MPAGAAPVARTSDRTRSHDDSSRGVATARPRPGEILVGKAGFEPAASASRTLRATKLRYFPSAGAPDCSAPPCLVIVAAGACATTLATLLRSILVTRKIQPANSS